jgi:hypothetical protein
MLQTGALLENVRPRVRSYSHAPSPQIANLHLLIALRLAGGSESAAAHALGYGSCRLPCALSAGNMSAQYRSAHSACDPCVHYTKPQSRADGS